LSVDCQSQLVVVIDQQDVAGHRTSNKYQVASVK